MEEAYAPQAPEAGSRIPPGKIFPDSVNIHDDEAKIAFEYLKKAALKIVAEEDAINEKKKTAQSVAQAEGKQRTTWKVWAIIGVVLALVLAIWILASGGEPQAALLALFPAGFAIYAFVQAGSHGKLADAQAQIIANLDRNFAEIKRDYRIDKLGVLYVPVATSVPFEGKSFVLDDTAIVENREFALYQMNNQDEFLEELGAIKDQETSLPLVETGDNPEEIATSQLSESVESVRLHDYLGTLDRHLRAASYLLNDLTKTSVSLPVVDPRGDYSAFLRDYCAEDITGFPVLEVFSQRRYADELVRFEEMNRIRKQMAESNAKFEKVLLEFIADLSAHVQLMSRAKLTSANKLADFSNSLLLNTFKASYNHYSGLLESEEIKRIQEEDFDYKSGEGEYRPVQLSPASRVRFDAVSGNWVAEDGSRTSFPFGVHQIYEEVIAPLVQNLLRENRVERMKIYNDIMDQKRDYLNQWHRDTDDFYGRGRAESNDIINLMQTTLAEFNTAISQYKAYEETEKSMKAANGGDLDAVDIKLSASGTAFSIAYCEEQTRQINQQREEFNDYIERLNEDINRRAATFGYTKYYDASLRDGHAKDVAMSMLAAKSLDERQKLLLSANSFIASNAQLPPPPALDGSVYRVLGENLNETVAKALRGLGEDVVPTARVDFGSGAGTGSGDAPDGAEPAADGDGMPADDAPEFSPAAPGDAAPADEIPADDASVDGAAEPEEETVEEDDDALCMVELTDAGPDKNAVVQLVGQMLGLDLKSAADVVESAPWVLMQNLSKDDALDVKTLLEKAGATVTIR